MRLTLLAAECRSRPPYSLWIALFAVLFLSSVDGLYLESRSPRSFSQGEKVELKVNALTSAKTFFPIEHYQTPFCQPEGGPVRDALNLGQMLSGDRIESSSYNLNMKEDSYCQQLCLVNLGKGSDNRLNRAIHDEYRNNWIVDNLPSAYKTQTKYTYNVQYWEGFPIGYVFEDEKAYVYNHVNLFITYHPVGDQMDKYRVVRFVVEPFSIKHHFTPTGEDVDRHGRGFNITNPIPSCDTSIPKENLRHTSYEMITDNKCEPQEANGYTLFTYDVIWREDLNLTWASRWDIYLTMEHSIPNRIHWFAITHSLVIVLLLTAAIVTIIVRNLNQELGVRYNSVASEDDETTNHLAEKGWKSLQGDVFRPPVYSPLLLCVCCGTGAQLLCMVICTTIFSALGFINPSRRGYLVMAELFFYVLMGPVAGYIASRFYQTFIKNNDIVPLETVDGSTSAVDSSRGANISPFSVDMGNSAGHTANRFTNSGSVCDRIATRLSNAFNLNEWQTVAICTAVGFPGLSFALFFAMGMMAWAYQSTALVPFWTMLILITVWFGISIPLVVAGAYFGSSQQEAAVFPVESSNEDPREIPSQPWFVGAPFSIVVGGILPCFVCYVEYFYILSSVWMGIYYYTFGFLLLVFIIVIVVVAEIAVLFNYSQLNHGNYRWWWRSFGTGGSLAIWCFILAIFYFRTMEISSLLSTLLYFGFMGLVSVAVFLMTGFIGVVSCLWFNITLFGSLKVE